jgi:hypothetical protein
MAANQFQKFAANGNFEGQVLKFLALDKASGKIKFAKQGLGNQGQYYSIVTDPKAGTIEVLNYSGNRVRFAPDDGKAVGAADGPKTDGTAGGPPIPPRPVGVVPAVPAVAPPIVVPVQKK